MIKHLGRNLENWMSRLAKNVRNIPLIYLAIPGSHNCMTYGITKESKIAPYVKKSIKISFKCFPYAVRRWAITQNTNIIGQLKCGVRFFDLRVTTAENSKLFFVHGLYCMEIVEPLQQIRNFLHENPKEFVILDFQHLYNFTNKDHNDFVQIIYDIFQLKMYTPNDGNLLKCTLNYCEQIGKQVLIIDRTNLCTSDMWCNSFWPNYWRSTATSVKKLKEFLDISLRTRVPETGFVSQCLISPDVKYITSRFLSSLKSSAFEVNIGVLDWILKQRPGEFKVNEMPRINVILGDFVCENQGHFCKHVLELNKYLV